MKILITGASSGIGRELALISAKRRYDVVITARRIERLEKIAQELRSTYDINVEVIEADLTVAKDKKKVLDYIDDNDIDIVVNNAGFGSAGHFNELDIKNELNMIDLNVKAVVEITYSALSKMIPKKRGVIVNLASIASYQPMVGDAVYGGTKAFVLNFTQAVHEEVKQYGVHVMAICPGLTSSEFMDRAKWVKKENQVTIPDFIWQTPAEVAQTIFKGIDQQRSVVIPGVVNKVFSGISSSLPGSLTRKLTSIVAKMASKR